MGCWMKASCSTPWKSKVTERQPTFVDANIIMWLMPNICTLSTFLKLDKGKDLVVWEYTFFKYYLFLRLSFVSLWLILLLGLAEELFWNCQKLLFLFDMFSFAIFFSPFSSFSLCQITWSPTLDLKLYRSVIQSFDQTQFRLKWQSDYSHK